MPVMPTAERTFDRSQQVSAFVRIYQGGSAMPERGALHMAIVDDHDAMVVDASAELPVAAFVHSRTADYRYTLPSRDWHSGAYLMTVSAVVGSHTAMREVRIDFR